MPNNQVELSIVIPIYNEAVGLTNFHASLTTVLKKSDVISYEIIYVDDGSTDNTLEVFKKLKGSSANTKLIAFSRNFGKESALSAGIASAKGRAILTIDGDGQHPVKLIPDFVKAWRSGSKVVIGLSSYKGYNWFRSLSSKFFHFSFNLLTDQKLNRNSTDFRLIDRDVQKAFLELKESDRLTRGLIDWLGFKREYITFSAKERVSGNPSYSVTKLIGLASNVFTSLSPKPLYIFGCLGVVITVLSFLTGLAVLIEQVILNDPLHWKFTGTAELGILILFLVGIVLISQGILSMYVSHIHSLAKQRPLYIVDKSKSVGLDD